MLGKCSKIGPLRRIFVKSGYIAEETAKAQVVVKN